MSNVERVSFGNAQIGFMSKVEETPTTSEIDGNVTINHMGRPGIPAHFMTSFMISAYVEEDGIEYDNIFHWTDIVRSDDISSPYWHIEDQAARKLAPALRAVADQIEQTIAEFDQRQREKRDLPRTS